uniref:Bifunctional lysine-specific demethylase and histidyl-hydroxylase n=1 Tax=Alexandrium monilatum TaxID=311494 RepID=A0A7S4RUP3_9DINO
MSQQACHGESLRGAAAPPCGSEEDAFARLIAPAGVKEFFEESWQRAPRVFRAADVSVGGEGGGSAPSCSREASCRPIAPQTWADCLDMLTRAWGAAPVPPPDGCDLLVFKGRQMTHAYEWSGPCAALLDGASCVVNHAEFVWPPLARLCMEMRSKLLHVYCNSYVTPPAAQAVPPHADDRDVFILQMLGCKHWRVFGNPPIKLPYTDEQVGKNGFPIPDRVFAVPPVIECVLQPGDVLYMPRGFVHEACCPGQTSSWHATLAVATHDWSWSKVFASTIAEAMDAESSAHWRAAVPLGLGTSVGSQDEAEADSVVEAELERLMDLVRQTVSVPALRKRLVAKLESHNWNQVEASSSFQRELSRCPPQEEGPAPLHWRTRFVREDARVRIASEESTEADSLSAGKGKCKGKGKGKGGIIVREELREAALFTMEELQRRRDEGLVVAEFAKAVPDGVDRMPFDKLAQLCLARVGVAAGLLQVVEAEEESGFCSDSARVGREKYRARVTACC